MPWKEVEKVELRRMFVSRVESGSSSVAGTCREFGISRVTGYKWLERYREGGGEGLRDRSRRPQRVAAGTDAEQAAALIADRQAHPSWGARKLRVRLSWAGGEVPSERTVHRIIKRAGLVRPEAGPAEASQRFERGWPNELWQMDHKGAIHGSWARRTVPLTVEDDCTRYLVGLRALPDKGLDSTWGALWGLFGEFGLPEAMLTDNDQVFHGRKGPSQLEARLLRLGIGVYHGRIYHPQTQGKVERLHGTLSVDLLRDGSFHSGEELQAGLDRFREEYNFERPHEALGMAVPGSRYRPSERQRPERLPAMEYGFGAELRRVQKDGWISWKGYCIEVGMGLWGERVEVREMEGGVEVYYGRHRILGEAVGAGTKRRSEKLGVGPGRRSGRVVTPLRATPFAELPPAKV